MHKTSPLKVRKPYASWVIKPTKCMKETKTRVIRQIDEHKKNVRNKDVNQHETGYILPRHTTSEQASSLLMHTMCIYSQTQRYIPFIPGIRFTSMSHHLWQGTEPQTWIQKNNFNYKSEKDVEKITDVGFSPQWEQWWNWDNKPCWKWSSMTAWVSATWAYNSLAQANLQEHKKHLQNRLMLGNTEGSGDKLSPT
jgi:hypothetical protein